MTMPLTYLCDADSIAERSAREFEITEYGQPLSLIVVRRDNQYYGYRNRCPHAGVPLNWQPDQFMDLDHHYLQCTMHGALFEVHNGYCVWGPCVGQSLASVVLVQEQGKIYVETKSS